MRELSGAIAPKFPGEMILNDIEGDIRILAELVESENSVIAEEQLERKRREDMVRATHR